MSNSPFSFGSVMRFLGDNFALVAIASLFFLGGWFVGSIMTENKIIKSGEGVTAQVAGEQDVVAAPVPEETGPTPEQLAAVPAVSDEDYIRGSQNAKVTVIEYSDYECPFCSRFHPTMQAVVEEYGDQVAWVYRHYPLGFHPNAQVAAETAECVGKLGGSNAFWAYGDAVFEEQEKLGGKLTPEAISTAVTASGVSQAGVDTCVESGEMTEKITAQMAAATKAGISGTPGSVIVTKDGAQELIPGALPLANVKELLEKYL